MKTKIKSTLAALSLAVLATLAISSCNTTGDNAGSGTHNMGGPKPSYPMSNDAMAGSH